MSAQPMRLPDELEKVIGKIKGPDADIVRTILAHPDADLGRKYVAGEVARGTTYSPAGGRHMINPYILWAINQRAAMEKNRRPTGFMMGGAGGPMEVAPVPDLMDDPLDLGGGIRIYASGQ